MATKDILEGMWRQIRGEAQARWGELTDDEIEQVEGKRDKLLGLLQERYGYAIARAEQEIDEFLREQRESASQG
jgi:uncharacterized protein YjbJ (UPF0337 family)